jgi:phosphatidylglycerophosphatase A
VTGLQPGKKDRLLLWAAQGFGIGRIPVAPGTFGSVLGIGWFALLLLTGSLWSFLLGSLVGVGLAVRLCGAGERILGQTDPGSVVLDEVAAMPVCFWYWVWWFSNQHHGALPPVQELFEKANWPLVLGVFGAFRLFDILKPPPVRQSQRVRGGWGIVIDDLLAAGYVNLAVIAAHALKWNPGFSNTVL